MTRLAHPSMILAATFIIGCSAGAPTRPLDPLAGSTADPHSSEAWGQRTTEARLAEIAAAERLVANPAIRGETRAELMLRLADLYFQQGREVYLAEMDLFLACQDATP